MTTTLLHEAGEALFGSLWQSALARELGVSDRSLRRWVAGAAPPAGVWTAIVGILDERAEALADVRARLEAEIRLTSAE